MTIQPVRWRSYDWGALVRAAVTAADLSAATVLYREWASLYQFDQTLSSVRAGFAFA
jgi:hypothetical protein